MAGLTAIENVILSNPELAEHPKLEAFIVGYYEALEGGYEPDPALLTDMFVTLIEIVPEEPSLQEALEDLETAIVEEVVTRDSNLETNYALVGMLTFYASIVASGYEPSEDTKEALVSALANVTTTDPALLDLLDDVVGSLADPIPAEPFNVLSVGTSGGARMISVATDGTMTQFDFLINNGGFGYGTAMGDINGDGLDDVLISGDWSGAVVHYADGSGGFTSAGVNITGQFQSQVEIADIDGDGDGDLYIQNGLGATEIWRNDNGSFVNTFSYTNIGSTGSYRTSGDARFADLNGDGALDMLIIQQDNQNPIADKIFFGDGAGGFTDAGNLLPTASGYGTSELVDVNNDGAVDYVTGTATGLFVALNDGSGNFSMTTTDLGPAFNGDIAVADFNGDGFLDAIRSDPDAGAGLELWLGDGTDAFVFDSIISAGVATGYGGGLSVGDFTGDGIADVVRRTATGIETLENDGHGNFVVADSLALSGYVFGEDPGLI